MTTTTELDTGAGITGQHRRALCARFADVYLRHNTHTGQTLLTVSTRSEEQQTPGWTIDHAAIDDYSGRIRIEQHLEIPCETLSINDYSSGTEQYPLEPRSFNWVSCRLRDGAGPVLAELATPASKLHPIVTLAAGSPAITTHTTVAHDTLEIIVTRRNKSFNVLCAVEEHSASQPFNRIARFDHSHQA